MGASGRGPTSDSEVGVIAPAEHSKKMTRVPRGAGLGGVSKKPASDFEGMGGTDMEAVT
jgi:hypothetical protein